MREPVLGPNAKPFFFQLTVGIVAYITFSYIGVGDLFYWLSCTYLTGTCS